MRRFNLSSLHSSLEILPITMLPLYATHLVSYYAKDYVDIIETGLIMDEYNYKICTSAM